MNLFSLMSFASLHLLFTVSKSSFIFSWRSNFWTKSLLQLWIVTIFVKSSKIYIFITCLITTKYFLQVSIKRLRRLMERGKKFGLEFFLTKTGLTSSLLARFLINNILFYIHQWWSLLRNLGRIFYKPWTIHQNFAPVYRKRQNYDCNCISAIYPVPPRLGLGFAGKIC